jgi:hypothetical protein
MGHLKEEDERGEIAGKLKLTQTGQKYIQTKRMREEVSDMVLFS